MRNLQEMQRQRKWDMRFLKLCNFVSNWSKDPSTKVGAVIVRKLNRIVSMGYNGYAAKVQDDDSLNIREIKYQRILHAELNAVLMAGHSLEGCTLYVYPLPPCQHCSQILIQSGISRIVFYQKPDGDSIDRWKASAEQAKLDFLNADIEFTCYNTLENY